MKFAVQDLEEDLDFIIALEQAVNFQRWANGSNHEIVRVRRANVAAQRLGADAIPVGSVEFVREYLKELTGIEPKPINIPEQLMDMKWTKRHVYNFNSTNGDLLPGRRFVKSTDTIKGFTEITDEVPAGNYLISDLVNIESEYRAFVYKGKLVGLKNYVGDFTLFPHIGTIEAMIESFTNAPVAYTLDIGILEDKGTAIIEVHDFFSCGLYGWNDVRIYPQMLRDWYVEYLTLNK